MGLKAFRVQNFMGFRDSGWIELRPITLFFGRNSTGKTALLRALLLLKQSSRVSAEQGPLLFSSEQGVDLGSFRDMAYGRKCERSMCFGFRCGVDSSFIEDLHVLAPVDKGAVEVELGFSWDPAVTRSCLSSVYLRLVHLG